MTPDRHAEFLAHYEKFKDKIYTYLWYRCAFDRAVAEDLTSDVFLKAFEAYKRFDTTRPFGPWIYRIAHNCLLNHYRGRRPTVDLETVTLRSEMRIEEEVGRGVEYQKALALIETIPTHHRDLLLLRYVDGLTNEEIADLHHKTTGAIRVGVHRALEYLRHQLNNNGTGTT